MTDIIRPYSAADVNRLRGSFTVEYTHAERGAGRLRHLLAEGPFVRSLGALTGNQAVQMAKAGLKSIYLSGWQVAADANNAGQMYPDQSLYPADSVPTVVRSMNNALSRADQIAHMEGDDSVDWMLPIVADAEAGFGGVLNAFELMKGMIEAGAAGVHFEDQLSSAKKCGHMGGKVLVPTQEAVNKLVAARLAADVCNVDTVIMARTDALSAKLLTSDHDPRDTRFLTGERTVDGFYKVNCGLEQAIDRGLAYGPYADLIWFETGTPDLGQAREFAQEMDKFGFGRKLAYNCSPSFNWSKHLTPPQILKFQEDLAKLGYIYQFVTLAGFHTLNYSIFDLATKYGVRGMAAYADVQNAEFAAESRGYTAHKHQREVGASYFDDVMQTITGSSTTTALSGSTEEADF